MDGSKNYVFQLTKDDIKKISEVVNVQPGSGIDLQRNNGRLEISIDRQQLRMWVQAIIRGSEI